MKDLYSSLSHHALLLALCAMASSLSVGCTVLTDFSECETSADCVTGVCSDGICNADVSCSSRAECTGVSADAYCLAGSCKVIDPARCPRLGQAFTDEADGVILPIGALMPLTGSNAERGNAASDGAELAMRQINANGGSTSGKFGLIVCDTQYQADLAVSHAKYLHEELGVPALMGAISSAETLSVVDQVAEPEKVLMISPASTSPGLSRRSDYFWRTIPSDAQQAPAMADVLATRNIQRAVVLYGGEQDPYGSGFYSRLTFYWAENQQLEPASVKTGIFDINNPLAALDTINSEVLGYGTAAEKPQAIILLGSLAASDLIAQVEAQYIQSLPEAEKPLWVLPEAMRDRTLFDKMGIKSAYPRIVGTAPLRTETPIYSTYETLLQNAFGLNARDFQFPDKAYDAAFLLALAYGAQQEPLEATGTDLNNALKLITSQGDSTANLLGTEFSRIAGSLRDSQNINVVGVSGELDFDEDHDITGAQITTWTINTTSGTPRFEEEEPMTPDGGT